MSVKLSGIATTVKLHRQKAGLSRNELAELCGVGKTVIYDIEHGKMSIRFDKLQKILDALNIRIVLESPLISAAKENP